MFTDWHVRVGLAGLAWTYDDLAEKAMIDRSTVYRAARGEAGAATMRRVRKAFEDGGLVFGDASVSMKETSNKPT